MIVIGGGHAGVEAALAAARMGADTLLLTQNKETVGQMSCNPSIGGIGKGHLVKEIDALGGIMAHAADLAGIHFRILNARKGPAVQATRAQADRVLYKQAIRIAVENQENLTLFQQGVDDLVVENDRVQGVVTQMGLIFKAKTVVLAVGTFLGGKIHIGLEQTQGGRAGDPPSNRLAVRLKAHPFKVGRLKTGTPARIDGRSIDFTQLEQQAGDDPVPVFSFLGSPEEHPKQTLCYIAHTNPKTHEIIKQGLAGSPLYNGNIEGIGPRYCPSIEDKVMRFSDKASHQIFVEPEGLTTTEIYPNGISTSLPFDVQVAFIQSIKGFEHAVLIRPGYAIEYDFFDPRDLYPTLETKLVEGLFFAGQINGTTGYEEAAAQGLFAGANAALKAKGEASWQLDRSESYLGVMIDDLLTAGTQEPYRMFTSRAEYRLSLREDNADLRLTEKGYRLGLVDPIRWKRFTEKKQAIQQEKDRLNHIWITPNTLLASELEKRINQSLQKETKALDLLRRPSIHYHDLMAVESLGPSCDDREVAKQIDIQLKYAGYIERQQEEIERNKKLDRQSIPENFEYEKIKGLSAEVKEKLIQHKPLTIGMAKRISGVTPAAISLLLVYLKKGRNG